MGEAMRQSGGRAGWLQRHRGLILPIGAASLIFAMLVPLPPALLDVLLAANIALAAIILLTTIYVSSPLEFNVFPSLLLGTTLTRLVLNVATTRLILTAGADGRSIDEAQVAAGKVIWAFSEFVTLGSLEVGVILFAIISIIQFFVVTRGAARISEVTARFVLDAMPGKQMSIDADLNAGLIDENQARSRRERITQEADFYGAMDGASKFLRGDALAAIIITVVNILGGLYVGLVQYGWPLSQTVALFTRLTIGDGLVTQIPAFLVSISAALIVTRSTAKSNLGEDVVSQLTSRPVALIITAVFLVALAFTSLPKLPLLTLGVGCAGLGWMLSRRRSDGVEESPDSGRDGSAAPATGELQVVQPLLAVEPICIELGYALVPMADKAVEGNLLQRIATIRRSIASQLGLLVPAVKIRDEMRMDAETYVIRIRGVKVASGRLHPRKLLAVSDGEVSGEIPGLDALEPTFATPAVWIARSQRERAEMLNYTVVAPSAVLATHLDETIRRNAAKLLSREQVARLLENLKTEAPSLVQEASETFKLGEIQKVLQELLRERVGIRDMEAILETMCDAAAETRDPTEMLQRVRVALGSVLTQEYCGQDGRLWCVSLEPSLEREITEHLAAAGRNAALAPTAERTRRIAEAVADGLARASQQGRKPVLLCDQAVRMPLRKILEPVMPEAAVLAYSEVASAEVQSVYSVGIE